MQRLEIYSASPFIHDGAVKAAWGGVLYSFTGNERRRRIWQESSESAMTILQL